MFRQRWYLIARNVRKDALRVYALDRITELEQTENAFAIPADFNPEDYFYNCFGVIRDEKIHPETVALRVLSSKRDYIRSLPLHHSQVETKTEAEYSDFTYYIALHTILSRKSCLTDMKWKSFRRHISEEMSGGRPKLWLRTANNHKAASRSAKSFSGN